MGDQVSAGELPRKDWAEADGLTVLAIAFERADRDAGRAADWYTRAMRWRGRIARLIRLLALVFFAIGGLVPIAKGFLGHLPAAFEWNDVGYVALALGAALLGFDYFFGISSSYTRFVTTEIALRNARTRFQADWLMLVSQNAPLKDGASLKPFIDLLQAFVSNVIQLVERETQEWVAEFRSSLSELEKLGNRAPRSPTPEVPQGLNRGTSAEPQGAVIPHSGEPAKPSPSAQEGGALREPVLRSAGP